MDEVEKRLKRLENQIVAVAIEMQATCRVLSTEPGISKATQDTLYRRMKTLQSIISPDK